ncbi:MAG: NUDIX hydrolase [Oscillospiraceae bacterium]|nr:NUDIX hydrolase [Oscillospiraceae bacterium]
MAERIDIFNRLGQATGHTQLRSEELLEDAWYQIVIIWTRDGDGKLLMTRRGPEKRFFPGCWEVTEGFAQAGEGPYEAAKRELREETGLEPEDSRWRYLGRIWKQSNLAGHHYQSMVNVYLVTLDEQEPEVCCQPEEVTEARWVTAEEYLAIPEEEQESFTPECFRHFRKEICAEIKKRK